MYLPAPALLSEEGTQLRKLFLHTLRPSLAGAGGAGTGIEHKIGAHGDHRQQLPGYGGEAAYSTIALLLLVPAGKGHRPAHIQAIHIIAPVRERRQKTARRTGGHTEPAVHAAIPLQAFSALKAEYPARADRTACRADVAPLPAVDAMIRRIDRVLRCSGQHAVCQVHAFSSFPGVLISISYRRPFCKSPTDHPAAFSQRNRPDTGFLSSMNGGKEIKRKYKDIPLLSGENRGT